MPKKRPYITAYLNEDEYAQVAGQAAQTGLSISAFVKRVCLAQEVRGTVDQRAALTLLQSKGDLGRLGGLLKQHLAVADRREIWHEDLRRLLRMIEAAQLNLTNDFKAVAKSLLQGKKE